MAAIPSSTLSGYTSLHEQVTYALSRCQELQGIDFKESATWDNLKTKIIKSALAMANLRDGGLIIIGVSESGPTWELTGVYPSDFDTFEVDVILDQVNTYASPHVDLDIVSVVYDNKRFLAVHVHEFADTPIVCKKNGPDQLQAGAVYIRPPGMARNQPVKSAQEMHDLLELAAEKRARKILELSRRIGLAPKDGGLEQKSIGPSNPFDKELGGV